MQSAYRKDIEGLRGVAVLAVIAFHLGYLTNGYLGVDVFFVISGYLITGIIHRGIQEGSFSLRSFYERRVRRIIPLTLLVGMTSLAIGYVFMLPGDLKNLAQSVVATNFFANNIQLYISTRDYWDVANHFKPMMHTWSLGVEEQFYLFFPLIFLLLRKRRKWVLPVLIVLAAGSLWLFYKTPIPAYRFYLLPFRFFELSMGGIALLLANGNMLWSKLKPLWLLVLFVLLCWQGKLITDEQRLQLVVLCSALLVGAEKKSFIIDALLSNRLMTGLGKISFSLYMWHQPVFAFYRYCFDTEIKGLGLVIVCLMVLILSIVSFYVIEQPFRNHSRINGRRLIIILGAVWLLLTGCAAFIYARKGIIRDVPELHIYQNKPETCEGENDFNNSVLLLDKDFPDEHKKTNILVVGNSFARDWVNVLRASGFSDKIELSYTEDISACLTRRTRVQKADFIFFTEIRRSIRDYYAKESDIDTNKVWIIGAKNFGMSNGIFYRKKGTEGYCYQRTRMQKGYQEHNDFLKREWKDRCIDLIGLVQAKDSTMPIFTPGCTFVSQDGRHLTRDGALYFAGLLAAHPVIIKIQNTTTRHP